MTKWTEKYVERIKRDLQDNNIKLVETDVCRNLGFKPIDCTYKELEMTELQGKVRDKIHQLAKEGKEVFPIIKGEK
jgi:hypothetical protein